MQKINLIILFLSALMALSTKSHAQMALFVAAGQSNAVGMADSSLSVEVPDSAAFEYKSNNNNLIPLKDPVGEARMNFGQAQTGSLWPSFASAYNRLSGKQVVIIPTARGGSSCNHKAELGNMGTWDAVGKMTLLDSAIKKTRSAEILLHQKVAGIIWLQGERDANAIFDKQLTAGEYESSLKSVIDRFRKGLGQTIPFYIVLTGNQRGREPKGNESVRQVQQKIASMLPAVYVVYRDTKDFEKQHLMRDFVHYNQQALNQMGKEIARRIMSLQSANNNK